MRMMLVLVALLGLAAHSAMGAPPVEKGAKESGHGAEAESGEACGWPNRKRGRWWWCRQGSL